MALPKLLCLPILIQIMKSLLLTRDWRRQLLILPRLKADILLCVLTGSLLLPTPHLTLSTQPPAHHCDIHTVSLTRACRHGLRFHNRIICLHDDHFLCFLCQVLFQLWSPSLQERLATGQTFMSFFFCLSVLL